MTIANFLGRVRRFMSVNTDNPEQLRAQLTALSRLIPLLYFILVANAWVLAATFFGKAPNWLSVYVALAFSTVCAIRLVTWWRRRDMTLTNEQTAHELRRTNKLAGVLGVVFSAWPMALFPYGDAYAQAHVALFMTIAILGSMLCLIHLRSAAVIVAVTVGYSFRHLLRIDRHIDVPRCGDQRHAAHGRDRHHRFDPVSGLHAYDRRAEAHRAVEQREPASRQSRQPHGPAQPTRLLHPSELRAPEGTVRGKPPGAGHHRPRRLQTGQRPLRPRDRRQATCRGGCPTSSIYPSDALFMFRLGGDEFAYVVANAPDNRTLVAQGDEISAILRIPFVLPEATVQISGSVGIAAYPEMATTAQQLFERADYALYHCKDTKRGGAVLFSAEHEAQINIDARIEQAFKCADFEQEFSIVFQPIVDIYSQTTTGFEALARWTSPTLGKVSPGQFIPVAERAGIISALTRPLLKKALATASDWPANLRLSFNLSAFDLNSAEGTLAIVSIIEGSGFDARRLDLEITETAFTHDFTQVHRSIDMLRLLGCGISLDDFGTGYSSLSRLHALPLTKIKIDRSFVTDLHKNSNSLKIVKSLLALSRDMELDCVIEGVETLEELTALRRLGGVMVQGYFYSPPINAEQVITYLNEERPTAIGA